MKKLSLYIFLVLMFCNVATASVFFRCENIDPKATLDYAKVVVDLKNKKLHYHWLGKPMMITNIRPDRVNAALIILEPKITWFASFDRYSGDLEVFNSKKDSKGVSGSFKCKKVDKLF